jgi:hypothetical protein
MEFTAEALLNLLFIGGFFYIILRGGGCCGGHNRVGNNRTGRQQLRLKYSVDVTKTNMIWEVTA